MFFLSFNKDGPLFPLSSHPVLWGRAASDVLQELLLGGPSVWVLIFALVVGKLKVALFIPIHFAFQEFLNVPWEMPFNKSNVSFLVSKL